MIVFIIIVRSTERFYAPFLIKSIKDILALGWFQRAEGRKEVFLFQIQQEVGWLFVLAVRLKFILQNKKNKVKHSKTDFFKKPTSQVVFMAADVVPSYLGYEQQEERYSQRASRRFQGPT